MTDKNKQNSSEKFSFLLRTYNVVISWVYIILFCLFSFLTMFEFLSFNLGVGLASSATGLLAFRWLVIYSYRYIRFGDIEPVEYTIID